MHYTATYSPDDNKLRIYGPRFDDETYQRVKAAGYRWAPRQELWVAPAWSPGREDIALELAGEIGDEDTSLVERAEARAERFEDYSDKRGAEANRAREAADQIAERFYGGQPILVGHHSEKRARKDQERIHANMRKAVNLWETAGYWADRAKGAIRNAKYKELPAVRARRIKGLESDLRKTEKSKAKVQKELKAWQACASIADPERQKLYGMNIANVSGYWSMSFPLADYPRDPPASQYEGPMGLWSAITGNIITAAQAAAIAIPSLERSIPRMDRWIAHYENRLAYERAMLAEAGGTVADQTKPEVGGAIKSWHFSRGWSYIQKVNKVTVTVWTTAEYSDRVFRSNVPLDKIAAIMSAAEVNVAKQEGRVRETGKSGKITGFFLAELEPPPAPTPPQAPSADDTAFQAIKDTLKAGGVQVVVANQLFPTPKAVAEQAVELLDIQPGDRCLEPSAGTGMLLGAMGGKMFGHNPERGSVVAIEINPGLANCLKRDFPLTAVICADFLDLTVDPDSLDKVLTAPFDKILMNPPFENGADIKHILHAFGMLKPGGRLVAICANGPRQQSKLMPLSRNWLALPNDTFKDAGTSVRTALIVMEKEPVYA